MGPQSRNSSEPPQSAQTFPTAPEARKGICCCGEFLKCHPERSEGSPYLLLPKPKCRRPRLGGGFRSSAARLRREQGPSRPLNSSPPRKGASALGTSRMLSSPQARGKRANSHHPRNFRDAFSCHSSYVRFDILKLRMKEKGPAPAGPLHLTTGLGRSRPQTIRREQRPSGR